MASGAGSCPQARVATRNSQIHEAVQRGNLAEVADVVQKDWGAVNEPGSQLVSHLACVLGLSWIYVMTCHVLRAECWLSGGPEIPCAASGDAVAFFC